MTSPIVASGTQIRTVVVTGGAVGIPLVLSDITCTNTDPPQPYKQWKFNTSSMIRDGLPDTLVGHDKSNINILRYPKDIVCKYMDALSEVPKIWSGKREEFEPQDGAKGRVHIDALIHIGMNPGSSAYSLEKRARRDGYEEPGEDGVYLPPSTFNGLPEELHPWFDLDDVAHRLSKELPVRLACPNSSKS